MDSWFVFIWKINKVVNSLFYRKKSENDKIALIGPGWKHIKTDVTRPYKLKMLRNAGYWSKGTVDQLKV